jgi:hypothetical protein
MSIAPSIDREDAPPPPGIAVARSVVVGDDVVVSFSGAPGNPTDWVGVYLRG